MFGTFVGTPGHLMLPSFSGHVHAVWFHSVPGGGCAGGVKATRTWPVAIFKWHVILRDIPPLKCGICYTARKGGKEGQVTGPDLSKYCYLETTLRNLGILEARRPQMDENKCSSRREAGRNLPQFTQLTQAGYTARPCGAMWGSWRLLLLLREKLITTRP